MVSISLWKGMIGNHAWLKKEDPKICCLPETHLTDRTNIGLRQKCGKQNFQTNDPWKQSKVTTIISEKIDFKPKLVRIHKKGHFTLIKEILYQENKTIVNAYVSNFIKQTLWN
jgi:hypothetical protein